MNRLLPLFLLPSLVLGAAAAGAAAQAGVQPASAPSPGPYASAVEASRGLIWERMAEIGIPGLSVAVVVDGEVVWAEGFGMADLENSVPVQAHTKFRIASISKALTAAAVGRLVQEGRLDLDAPVQNYVPSFPLKRWPVTTRQIAGHVAGVRHYRGDEFASAVQYDDVVDALEIFESDTLLFEPGSDYAYSTYGWNLVSAVVQGASGRPFLRYMWEEVLDPLALRETVAEHIDSIIPGRARFYLRGRDGRTVNAPFVNNSNKWAGGGYLSTARDMARYGSSYLDLDLLEATTVEVLWTPQTTRDGESTGYGIGWSQAEVDGVRHVWHTGGAMGGSTILTLRPDDGVVVAILTNLQSVRHVELARSIGALFASASHP
ncbi:MAG: beta-lactamase family protein [Gemmatimonadales bacterium]|jgi:CubicO group peptidase (beta-lactamase class C family)|nr:MAG: beta-lactamase family protein [Gemmatimonadales bacterium]